MKAKSVAVVGLSVLLLSGVGLSTSAGDSEKTVRFGLLYGSPNGDFTMSSQVTQLDETTGIFASAEFPVNDRFGLEPGVGYAKHDITVDEPGFPTIDFGETTWMAVTVNGNFHVMRNGKIDLYVGPTVGYVFWDTIDTGTPSDVPTDDEFALGANLGIDVPFGESSWSFSGALRYLVTDLGIQGGSSIGVDPLQVKVGLSVGF